MATESSLLEHLDTIVQINIHRRQHYENAVKQVREFRLRQLLSDCCRQSNDYINEWKQVLLKYGGAVRYHSPFKKERGLQRTRADMGASWPHGSKVSLIKSCLLGDEQTIKAYSEAKNGIDMNVYKHLWLQLDRQQWSIEILKQKVRSLSLL